MKSIAVIVVCIFLIIFLSDTVPKSYPVSIWNAKTAWENLKNRFYGSICEELLYALITQINHKVYCVTVQVSEAIPELYFKFFSLHPTKLE